MSRRLILALLAPLLAAVATAASSTSASAYRPHFRVCVVAKHPTWLFTCDGCRHWVRKGRAFRVEWQHGDQLLVRNLETQGWVHLWEMSLARQSSCDAAGI